MRRNTRKAAGWLGAAAGLAGIEHGIFEILRGPGRPPGLVIESIGPPCVPEQAWNACEPALTVIPDYLITGILAVVFGLAVAVWSIFFLEKKNSGWIQILLSILLLLFGGGFFPPLIGLVSGAAAITISRPLPEREPGKPGSLLARIWPWPLVVFLVWVAAQWLVGYFWNEWLQRYMIYGVVLILLSLILSVFSAAARDRQTGVD